MVGNRVKDDNVLGFKNRRMFLILELCTTSHIERSFCVGSAIVFEGRGVSNLVLSLDVSPAKIYRNIKTYSRFQVYIVIE